MRATCVSHCKDKDNRQCHSAGEELRATGTDRHPQSELGRENPDKGLISGSVQHAASAISHNVHHAPAPTFSGQGGRGSEEVI